MTMMTGFAVTMHDRLTHTIKGDKVAKPLQMVAIAARPLNRVGKPGGARGIP